MSLYVIKNKQTNEYLCRVLSRNSEWFDFDKDLGNAKVYHDRISVQIDSDIIPGNFHEIMELVPRRINNGTR